MTISMRRESVRVVDSRNRCGLLIFDMAGDSLLVETARISVLAAGRLRIESVLANKKKAYEERYPDRAAKAKAECYARNREKYIREGVERKRRDKEAVNERYREQYAACPEQWKIRQARYKSKDPERVTAVYRAANSRRRARIDASLGHYTAEDVLRLYRTQKGHCAEPNCRISLKSVYHVDHIMPVAKGGSNAADNIQLLCPRCNLRKNDKDPIEWARLNGRLF